MRKASAVAVIWLAVVASFAQGDRGPSTRSERDRAVKVTHALEQDPLSPSLRADREWLFKWIVAVPDISIAECTDPVFGSGRYKYSTELRLQKIFSSATFIIENSARNRDDLSVETAGVEGALKAYEAILKKAPGAHSAYWDSLLKKRSDGTLRDYVSDYMEKACGSDQTRT